MLFRPLISDVPKAMTTLKDTLLDKRRLAAVFRKLTHDEKRHLAESIADLFEQEIFEQEAERQRLAAIEKHIAQMMSESGATREEVIAVIEKQRRKDEGRRRRSPRAKYEYTHAAGFYRTWSGRGTKPTALQRLLDEGADLRDFLIPEQEG